MAFKSAKEMSNKRASFEAYIGLFRIGKKDDTQLERLKVGLGETALDKLKLKVGDTVDVLFDDETGRIMIKKDPDGYKLSKVPNGGEVQLTYKEGKGYPKFDDYGRKSMSEGEFEKDSVIYNLPDGVKYGK